MSIKIRKMVKAVRTFGTEEGKKTLLARQSSSTSFLTAGMDVDLKLD